MVSRRRETHDRVGARVAHIDADEHGSLLAQDVRELHVEEVPTDLAVDLAKDVRGLGSVE